MFISQRINNLIIYIIYIFLAGSWDNVGLLIEPLEDNKQIKK